MHDLPFFSRRFRQPVRLLLLAVAGLSSCALTGTHSGSSVKLPAAWRNSSGFPTSSARTDLSRWWNQFDDPKLGQIIRIALENNPDMASASSRIRESRARRASEISGLFPTLSGSTSARAQGTHLDGGGGSSGESYSTGLDASWEIDLFGKRRSAIAASSADLGATEENFNSVQAALAAEVAFAYLDLRSAESRLVVVRESVKSRESTYQLADMRNRAGQTDELEARQSLSSLEQARASIPTILQTIAQVKNRLALLAGKTPGELDGRLSGSRGIPNPSTRLAIGIPTDTIRQRPDVRVAGYQWVATMIRSDAARLERLPSLSLNGALGLNTISTSKLFNPETATASVVAGLSGPIFDAGRIRNQIAIQDEQEVQALNTYTTAVLTGLSEVEDALIACRRTAERITITERAAENAREAARLAELRYQAGVVDLLTVLDAQRTNLSLDEQLVVLRADRASSYISLYKALGGGWSPRS